MNRLNIRAAAVVALATLAIFFTFAGDGLQGYFAPDEMMNLYQAWSPPVTGLIHHDRPLGELVYRGLFAGFGLRPLPYRIFCLLLLVVNLALLFRFCRLVSGSVEVAALAVLSRLF